MWHVQPYMNIDKNLHLVALSFGGHLVVIWWLFGGYLVVIWWLFGGGEQRNLNKRSID
jgi:hypothetical protein